MGRSTGPFTGNPLRENGIRICFTKTRPTFSDLIQDKFQFKYFGCSGCFTVYSELKFQGHHEGGRLFILCNQIVAECAFSNEIPQTSCNPWYKVIFLNYFTHAHNFGITYHCDICLCRRRKCRSSSKPLRVKLLPLR